MVAPYNLQFDMHDIYLNPKVCKIFFEEKSTIWNSKE